MAKDYAKKKKGSKKTGASRGKNKSAASPGLIFVTFLLLAGLISFLVYIKWFQPKLTQSVSTNKQETVSTTKLKPSQPNKTDIKKVEQSKEDEVPFYRTHEEMVNKTVDIPIEDLKLPEDEHKYVYLMPCGSFRDAQRAEELKAQIAFAGYESKINQVDAKSGRWYRVELGPFKSKRKAESIRHRLQDNGFNFCKIWPKKIK